MKRIVGILVLVACGVWTLASGGLSQTGSKFGPDIQKVFEQFKKLEGEWIMAGEDGKPTGQVTNIFKLTAAGSVVVEKIFPGASHEMITVYHLDGEDLVLTHYCALKNQPRMKAAKVTDPKKVVFQFVGATNMKSEKEMHMHDAVFHFLSENHIKSEWTHYKDGKPAGVVTMNLIRKTTKADPAK